MKKFKGLIGGLLAACILASGAVMLRAETIEGVAVKGDFGDNTSGLVRGIGQSFKEWWRKEQQRARNQGIDWSNHPCKPDEVREDGGDSGVICRSKEKFVVSCRVTEWDVFDGEGGPYRVPRTIESCTCNDKPCGGFAGSQPADPGPQSP